MTVQSRPGLSIIIPAHNEEENLPPTVAGLALALEREAIRYEIIVVNDNSVDDTLRVAEELAAGNPSLRIVNRTSLGGFGRAVRAGLEVYAGSAVTIVMADQSDDPVDVIRCFRKLEEGYDCVFGSRFRTQSRVVGYPRRKLVVNRVVNKTLQLMFWTRFNDLTNAFKVYRREVVEACGPYSSSHFNLTIEMSLTALIREYRIAEIPINWYGRTWGGSSLSIAQMGRRYLSVLLRLFSDRLLIGDDILEERAMTRGCDSDRDHGPTNSASDIRAADPGRSEGND